MRPCQRVQAAERNLLGQELNFKLFGFPYLAGTILDFNIFPLVIGEVRKALLVGINYRNTGSELRGCINDVNNMQARICRDYRENLQI